MLLKQIRSYKISSHAQWVQKLLGPFGGLQMRVPAVGPQIRVRNPQQKLKGGGKGGVS
jgi:hypothetical protein